jgi:hypothetical protein
MTVAAAAAAMAVVLFALPASAGAVEVTTAAYHPDQNARSFTTGNGGWTAAHGATGLCVPLLICPAMSTGFAGSGGAGGASDGYLRTVLGTLTGVGSESRAVLTGPAFTYNGVDGKDPTSVTVDVSHLARVGDLLSVAGNSAQFSFELVDQTSGTSQQLINGAELHPESRWTSAPQVALNPSQLTIGHQYRLKITTRFIYGAQVLPGGTVGYDDVVLTAIRDKSELPGGGGNGGGGNGGGGNGNGNGNNGNNNPNNTSAVFDGRNLFIKLQCFGVSKHGKCWNRATALKGKHGKRYTFPVQRVVKAKKGKVIRARVRFQFRNQLEHQRTITLRSVLRTSRKDKSKRTKYTKLQLIKRG